MGDKAEKLLVVLAVLVLAVAVNLSERDLTVLLSDLSADVNLSLLVEDRLSLRESHRFQVNKGDKYKMLSRVWGNPLSFGSGPRVPHALLMEATGSAPWYAKDYLGRVKGNYPRSAFLLIEALAQRNELGLVKPSGFPKGSYLLKAVYSLFPAVEVGRELSLVRLSFVSRHPPYGKVSITVQDPLGKVKEVFPLFPYISISRSGDRITVSGYLPSGRPLELDLIVRGKVDGYWKDVPSLKVSSLPRFAHHFWVFLLNGEKLIAVFIPALLFYLHRKYRREREFPVPQFFSLIPNAQRPPWLVNLVFNGDPFEGDENGFYAALLDLSRRGVVEMREGRIVLKGPVPEEAYERRLLSLLARFSRQEGKERIFDPEYLVEVAERLKESNDLTGLKILKEELDSLLNFTDSSASAKFVEVRGKRAVKFLLAAALALSGGLAFSAVSFGRVIYQTFDTYPLLTLSLGLTVSLLISLLLPVRFFVHWRRNYYLERLQWEAFKRFLEEIVSLKKYAPKDANVWREWFVYGTALGVSDRVRRAVEELGIDLPEAQELDTFRSRFSLGYYRVNSGLHTLLGSREGPFSLRRRGR